MVSHSFCGGSVMKHAITLFSIAALAVATLSVQLVGQEAADKPSAKAAAAQDDKAVERVTW